MNLKEEIIVAYLEQVETEDQIWNTGDEFPSFCGGDPVFLEPVDEKYLKCDQCQQSLKFLLQLYAPLEIKHATYRVNNALGIPIGLKSQDNKVKPLKSTKISQSYYFTSIERIDGIRFSAENPMIVSPDIVDSKQTNKLLRFAKQLLPDKKKQKPNSQKQENYKQDSDDDDDDNINDDEGWENMSQKSQHIERNHDEVENTSSSGDDSNITKVNQPKYQKIYDKFLDEQKTKTKVEQAIEFSELNDFEKDAKNKIDGDFLIYQHFITEQENHILRYCFSAATQPLWFSDKQQFSGKDVPNCIYCGAKKNFEVQINNSILSFYRELYGLEWGALFIYSCPKSCKNQSLTYETLMIQYDDHEEQFSDVSVDSAHIKQQIQDLKKNNKPKKAKPVQQVIKEETKFAEDNDEDW